MSLSDDPIRAGRIAVAWMPPGDNSPATEPLVVYDLAFDGTTSVAIPLEEIAAPSPDYLECDRDPFRSYDCYPVSEISPYQFGFAHVYAVADSNGDNAISTAELQSAQYGLAWMVLVHSAQQHQPPLQGDYDAKRFPMGVL